MAESDELYLNNNNNNNNRNNNIERHQNNTNDTAPLPQKHDFLKCINKKTFLLDHGINAAQLHHNRTGLLH